MSYHLDRKQIRDLAADSDRLFGLTRGRTSGLPTGLYAATVALYLAIIGLTTSLLLDPALALPMVVVGGFILFAFGFAGHRVEMKPRADIASMPCRAAHCAQDRYSEREG